MKAIGLFILIFGVMAFASDAEEFKAGNLIFKRNALPNMDFLTVENLGGNKLCSYASDNTVLERFQSVKLLNFKKAPNRYFLTEWSNSSLLGSKEFKILDMADPNDSCMFGPPNKRDQVFSGIKVTYEFKNEVLVVTVVTTDDVNSLKNFKQVTRCTINSDKALSCSEEASTPYP